MKNDTYQGLSHSFSKNKKIVNNKNLINDNKTKKRNGI